MPLVPVLLAAGLLLAAPESARAHSLLVEASPAPNAALARPPARVALRFNNRIEKRLSRIDLVDARGTARALTIEAGGAPDRLEAAAPPLEVGSWRLQWQVLSTDGHVVSGGFPFRITP